MTEDEKMKVLNLIMWLQVGIYAADECEPIKWFYTKQTKQLLKRLVDTIQKEHGLVIKALWEVDGVKMPDVTRATDEFANQLAKADYYKLPDITRLIEMYNNGEMEKYFVRPKNHTT